MILLIMKQCRKCLETKPVDQFHKNRSAVDGLRKECKVCAPEYNKAWQAKNPEKAKQSWLKAEAKSRNLLQKRARKYGLTELELAAMIEEANGRCDICGAETVNLHVDHCHDSNQVRGMLCLKCNTGLGNFNDDVELMKKAIKYLGV